MPRLIYLDNNATTQCLPEVVEAMLPFLRESYANPSSIHQFGQSARHAVEVAREQTASLIGATAKEIVFTSGGTESINLAIRGALSLHPDRRRIVTSSVEHSAVLRVCERLETEGFEVIRVGVSREGQIDEDEWSKSITPDTALVSILHVNNETGVIFDVAKLAAIASERGVPVHVDAVQSAGKLDLNVHDWPVQFVSLAAHKFHGPKGTGALYVRRRTRMSPMILGGSQERELRGGTENVAGIVGMGFAAQCAKKSLGESAKMVGELRDRLEQGITNAMPIARVNAANANRIYNTSNIAFDGLEAEAILILLSEAGICASAGAACSSGSLEPSHVLKAMGLGDRLARGSIRFSLSRFNSSEEVDEVIRLMPTLLSRLVAMRTTV